MKYTTENNRAKYINYIDVAVIRNTQERLCIKKTGLIQLLKNYYSNDINVNFDGQSLQYFVYIKRMTEKY